MKSFVSVCMILLLLCLFPIAAFSQVDNFGTLDTVYADLVKIDAKTWSVTVSYTNDEKVDGLSIPLKLTAGTVRVVADSAVYTGGRVESFAYKGFRADTAIQCVTLGMIANLGPTTNFLAPGQGRLVTFFVSSLDGEPIEKLDVDTTTTNPNNSLMTIANRFQEGFENIPDTIPINERELLEILPAFASRHSK